MQRALNLLLWHTDDQLTTTSDLMRVYHFVCAKYGLDNLKEGYLKVAEFKDFTRTASSSHRRQSTSKSTPMLEA